MDQNISIIPSTAEHYKEILKIYNEGFCSKFRYITKKKEKQLSIVNDFGIIDINSGDKEFAAVKKGKVIGFLSLRTNKNRSTIKPAISYKELFRKYGLVSLLKAAILDIALNHTPKKGELYIDTVGVSSEARGHGVGSLLLDFTESFAEEHNLNKITLSVMYENPRAKALYERRGFQVQKSHSLWWLKKSTGFSGADFMVKEL